MGKESEALIRAFGAHPGKQTYSILVDMILWLRVSHFDALLLHVLDVALNVIVLFKILPSGLREVRRK
jgi:hypothetical protein